MKKKSSFGPHCTNAYCGIQIPVHSFITHTNQVQIHLIDENKERTIAHRQVYDVVAAALDGSLRSAIQMNGSAQLLLGLDRLFPPN